MVSARPVSVSVSDFDPLLQRFADLGRLAVQTVDQLAPALAEGPCGLEGAAGQRLHNGAAALREALVDPAEQGFERPGHFPELARGPFVEGLEPRLEGRRGLVAAAAKLFVERAAAFDQHVLDRSELGGEVVRQRIRPIADLCDQLPAAPVDRAFEPREAVPERRFDPASVRSQRRIDGVEVRGRDRFELAQSLGGLGRKLFQMSAEALAEVFPAGPQHRVDRVDVAGDVGVQLVRVGGDPVDHAVPVLSNQIVERLHIFPHPAVLVGQRRDQPSAALADDPVERRHLGAERVVKAARSERDGRCGVACERDETLGDLRRFGVEPVERSGRRLFDLGLGGGALNGERSDDSLCRLADHGVDRRGLPVDGAAQLGFPLVEPVRPALGGGIEDGGGILGAVAKDRGEPFARAVEPVAKRPASFDQRFVQAIGDPVEPSDQIVAAPDHGVGQPRLTLVDAVDQRQRAIAEIARQRVGRFDQASGEQLALDVECLHRFRALCVEAADDLVGVAVNRVAHKEGGFGKSARHDVSVRPDDLRRFRESRRDAIPVRLQRFDRVGAARADPGRRRRQRGR